VTGLSSIEAGMSKLELLDIHPISGGGEMENRELAEYLAGVAIDCPNRVPDALAEVVLYKLKTALFHSVGEFVQALLDKLEE